MKYRSDNMSDNLILVVDHTLHFVTMRSRMSN